MQNKISELEIFFQLPHKNSFELIEGKGKVMISAPHSVSQLRNNKLKEAEPQTGVIAKILSEELGIPVIYKTKNCNDDANFDEVSDYKNVLAEYIKNNGIKVLIDLHQLSPDRDIQVDIGTANFKNLTDKRKLNVILEAFTEKDFGKVQIDVPFGASSPNTVSSFIHENTGIESVQIEINSRLLFDKFEEYKFCDVYQAIKKIIQKLGEIADEEADISRTKNQ